MRRSSSTSPAPSPSSITGRSSQATACWSPGPMSRPCSSCPTREVGPLFVTAKRLAAAVTVAMDAEGSFVALNNVVSQSVPHLHVHVVPRRPKDGLRGFFWPRTKYASAEEMEEVRARIAAALGSRRGGSR